jgi:GTP-binding protein HflX
LVGYTNAGKTALFNALTGAEVRARNTLFATLDPTIRRLSPGAFDEVLLVDTVGFVRDLPHELVVAFRATLTETREADLLVHVIDASDPHNGDRKRQVEIVINTIGAGNIPCIHVYNKSDKVKALSLEPVSGSRVPKLQVSAITGEGVEGLAEVIRVRAVGEAMCGKIELGPGDSKLRSKLFDLRAVKGEQSHDSGGWTLEVALTSKRWKELCIQEGLSDDNFQRV